MACSTPSYPSTHLRMGIRHAGMSRAATPGGRVAPGVGVVVLVPFQNNLTPKKLNLKSCALPLC